MIKNQSLFWSSVGFLFIGISIPLILEKVPPNKWYGLRVAKTFSSERIWYAANRIAGYDLLWSGVAVVITAVITGLLMSRLGLTTIHIINLTIFISALVVAVIHSLLYLNRL